MGFQLGGAYLEEKSEGLEEIAVLLGYWELSALDHAGRRWTGQTPRGFRRKERARIRDRAHPPSRIGVRG